MNWLNQTELQQINFAVWRSLWITFFNERNIFITGKLLKQGYRYFKLRKYFTKFYNCNFDLISKLLRQGISQPVFTGMLFTNFLRSWVIVIFLLCLLKLLNVLLKGVMTLLF
jgi:hypothetical protein